MQEEHPIRQAVILAGGKGTRLASELRGLPKPLIDVCGRPLLDLQVALLTRYGFRELLILVDYEAEKILDYCRQRGNWGVRVKCIEDGVARGTAGAVLAAYEHLADEFLVMYGDTMVDVDLTRFATYHRHGAGEATLFLHPNDHPHDSDLVEIDDAGRISAIHGYPHDTSRYYPNLVSAALYIIRKSAITPWITEGPPLDFGKNLFRKMLAAGCHLKGYVSPEYIKDLGTPSRLAKVRNDVKSGKVARASLDVKQAAVFLDRDGTINTEVGHVKSPDELKLLPGIGAAIRRLNGTSFRTILVTNQPVVARGDCSFDTLKQIQYKLETELGREGAYLDRIYFCPHHPDKGFEGEIPQLKMECECRKPKTGMIDRATAEFNIDHRQSWFIGDTTTDILTARNAGLKSILVETGFGGLDYKAWCVPDFICPGLPQAVEFLLDVYPKLHDMCLAYAARFTGRSLAFVGGLARTGKSTFANALAYAIRESGQDIVVISVDRWLRDESYRQVGVQGRYDMHALAQLVHQLESRTTPMTIDLPAYHKIKKCRIEGAERITIDPGDVVILEGVVAVNVALMEGVAGHYFQVELDEATRKSRIMHEYKLRGFSEVAAHGIYTARQIDETPYVLEVLQRGVPVERVSIPIGDNTK